MRDYPLEIRNSQSTNGFGAVAAGALAAILGFGIVRALIVGTSSPGRLFVVILLFLLAAGFAAYHGRSFLDRRVQLTLSGDGFRDRRSGNVLVPWPEVERAQHLPSSGEDSALVVFHLKTAAPDDVGFDVMTASGRPNLPLMSGRRIQVEISSLDISPDEFLRAVTRFAPHVEVS